MKPTFVSGRNNLALTIMVPFDCPNNCPFCESKKEYATNRPNLAAVLSMINLFFKKNNTLDVPEVVITGGEPMADIRALYAIINAIPSDKDIYINTTLIKKNFEAFVDLVNNHPQIKGINVSRHCTTYEEDCKTLHGIVVDEEISRIKKPVRINCVIKSIANSLFRDIVSRWEGKNVELSFREDFNTMTTEELHNPYTVPFALLGNVKNYVGNTHCKVCDTTTFLTRKDMVVRYHKGIKNTLVYLDNSKWEINDIIIRQDGSLFCDWDFTNAHFLPPQLLHKRTIEETRAIHHKIVEETKQHIGGCGGYVSYTCGGYGGCGGGVMTYQGGCGGGGC